MGKKKELPELEEKLEMSWRERRILKKAIKKITKRLELNKKDIEKSYDTSMKLDEETILNLQKMKQTTIECIIGNKEKEIVGLADIFEITEGNKELTKEDLEKMDLNQLTELFEDLIDNLEGII